MTEKEEITLTIKVVLAPELKALLKGVRISPGLPKEEVPARLPSTPKLMIVGHDIVVEKTPEAKPLADFVQKFAKLDRASEDVLIFNINRLSLWKAAEKYTADKVVDFLKQHAKMAPKDSLKRWIFRTMSMWDNLKIRSEENYDYLEAADEKLMDRILSMREVKSHIFRRLASTKARIIQGHRGDLKQVLIEKGYPVKDLGRYEEFSPLRYELKPEVMRDPRYAAYQKEAVEEFLRYGSGTIVLPGGSGKTVIAVMTAAQLKAPTLVLVTRAEIGEQFKREFLTKTTVSSYNVACIHGQSRDRTVKPITICTYQIATGSLARQIWNRQWGLVIFDECLTGNTPILLADGTSKTIGEIVEQKLYPEVLSLNLKTGRIEPKRVTWFFKGYSPILAKLQTEDGRIIYATPNHKIFSRDRYVGAKDLNIGDQLIACRDMNGKNGKNIYLQGMRKGVQISPIFSGTHDASQTSRTQCPCSEGTPLEIQTSREIQTDDSEILQRAERRRQSSLERREAQSHSVENCNRGVWIPNEMHALRRNVRSKHVRLTSQRRKQTEQLKSESNNPLSVMSREHSQRRNRCIGKLGTQIRAQGEVKAVTDITKVVKREIIQLPKPIPVYDIEVEDNHNFFANGILISNSQHVPAKVWSRTTRIQAIRRLGLTATPVREDKQEKLIFSLIGPGVYEKGWLEMAEEGYVAKAKAYEVLVDMPERIARRYSHSTNEREKYVLASTNPGKYPVIARLLERHKDDPVLIIGYYVQGALEIGKKFDIPVCWGEVPPKQRHELYDKFRSGQINKLVLTSVGEEGVDLPRAKVLIEVCGLYGSRAQMGQRFSRILRPKKEEAIFYELVSRGTTEQDFSEKRRQFLIAKGYEFEEWKEA